MFFSSLAFRKIKPNQYSFIPGWVYTSKAFVVTYKEKQKLTSSINLFTIQTLSLTSGCLVPMKRMPKIGIPLCFILFFLAYLKYKITTKKIIGKREKQHCQRQTFIGYQKKLANILCWQSIRIFVRAYIFMFFFLALLIHFYYQSNNLLILSALFFFSFVYLLGLFLLCFKIYLKWKYKLD